MTQSGSIHQPTDSHWGGSAGSETEIGPWRDVPISSPARSAGPAGAPSAAAEPINPASAFVSTRDVLKEWRAAERELGQTVPGSTDWQRVSSTLAALRSAYRRLFDEIRERLQRY